MDEKVYKNRWRILGVVLLGPFMATIDSSIVNVALPVMSQKLSVGINTIQWVVTSYLITISALVLIFGKIADIIGKSIIFQYGFLIFSLGSFMCGISNSASFLILSRVIQAVGAAMFMSSNQGIIASVFPKNERGRALGLSATTVAVGTMLGPPIGGIIVEFFNWQWIFLINIPIAVIGYFIGRGVLPRKEKTVNIEKFDFKGSYLFVISIVSLFWAMLTGEKLGWGNKIIIFSFVISALCLIYFYFVERNTENPIIDLSMFKNKLFNISIFCAFVSFAVIFCNGIIQPFYLQYVMKISPARAGVIMIVFPLSAGIVAPVSGYVSDKIGGEVLTSLGLLVTTIGALTIGFLNTSSSYFDIVSRIAILGIGNGMFQSPNNSIVMSLVPKNKLGIAGSINALVRNVGMVFGIAFSVSLLYNRMSSRIGYKVTSFIQDRPDVFIYAMKIVYISAAAMCFIGTLLTAFRLINSHKTVK